MRIFVTIAVALLAFVSLYSAEQEDDFELLMGKETPHWRHLHQEIDVALLKNFHALYLQNKNLQFQVNVAEKIPKVIHIIWLGPRPFPAKSVENVRSWIAKNPGWIVKFWTDRDRDLPCHGLQKVFVRDFKFQKLEKFFYESENWGEKSDLLRYEILLREGGIYVDHDAVCIKSFEGLCRGYDFFAGLEPPHEAFAGRNITCANGLIGIRPHHPVMSKVIDLVVARWDALGRQFRGRDDYSKVEVVMRRTYIPFTEVLQETLVLDGNKDIVFPAAYFMAKSGIPSIYAKQLYETLWDESRHRKTEFEKSAEKSFSRLEQKSENILYFLLGLTFLNSAIFALLFSSIKKRAQGNL